MSLTDEDERHDGRGLCFWYQATRLARASASCRYRMGHLAELLAGATTVVDAGPSADAFRDAAVVIVVRPFLDDRARRVLHARQALRIADFDDLLFAGDPAAYPLVRAGTLSARECALRIAQYRAGLADFDAFTVSTERLRDELAAAMPHARIALVPNGLSPRWVEQGRALYRAWQPGDPKVIRYFCGSPSHDADFAHIAPALADFLDAHAQMSLDIVGPLEGALPHRTRQLPRVPYGELPRLLASSWVAIAPLARTPFNACKSAIKFLEAAAFGTPCIASPNSDMERHAGGGVLLAESAHDWQRALTRLLDDDFRMALAARGRHHVDQHGLARTSVAALMTALETWHPPS